MELSVQLPIFILFGFADLRFALMTSDWQDLHRMPQFSARETPSVPREPLFAVKGLLSRLSSRKCHNFVCYLIRQSNHNLRLCNVWDTTLHEMKPEMRFWLGVLNFAQEDALACILALHVSEKFGMESRKQHTFQHYCNPLTDGDKIFVNNSGVLYQHQYGERQSETVTHY